MASYRIGLIAADSTSEYPRSLRLGIQNTVEAAGHTLVSVGELVPSRVFGHDDSYLRVACALSNRLDLDVPIVSVGSMSSYVLRRSLPKDMLVCRMGGDEFVAVVPGCPHKALDIRPQGGFVANEIAVRSMPKLQAAEIVGAGMLALPEA